MHRAVILNWIILCEILDKKRFISCHSYVQSEINMLMQVGDSMGFYDQHIYAYFRRI